MEKKIIKTYTIKEMLFEFGINQDKLSKISIYCSSYETAKTIYNTANELITSTFRVNLTEVKEALCYEYHVLIYKPDSSTFYPPDARFYQTKDEDTFIKYI